MSINPNPDPRVKHLRDAQRRVRSALIANADRLSTPFTDDPDKNPWDTYVRPAMRELKAAVDAVAASSAVSVVPPATNQAALLAAAVFVEAMSEACDNRRPCESCTTREDVASELRRVAAGLPAVGSCVAAETPQTGAAASCGCGEPATLGTVHRADGPCYIAETPPTETPDDADPPCTCAAAGDCFAPAGHYADCPSATAPAVVAQPGKETDTGVRIVAHVLATHTDLHCLNCAPPPHGDVWTPVTAEELDDGGVCVRCGVDVLIPQAPQ